MPARISWRSAVLPRDRDRAGLAGRIVTLLPRDSKCNELSRLAVATGIVEMTRNSAFAVPATWQLPSDVGESGGKWSAKENSLQYSSRGQEEPMDMYLFPSSAARLAAQDADHCRTAVLVLAYTRGDERSCMVDPPLAVDFEWMGSQLKTQGKSTFALTPPMPEQSRAVVRGMPFGSACTSQSLPKRPPVLGGVDGVHHAAAECVFQPSQSNHLCIQKTARRSSRLTLKNHATDRQRPAHPSAAKFVAKDVEMPQLQPTVSDSVGSAS